MLTRTDLIREAAATGFQAEPLEKVIRLLGLLDALRSHPFLKTRIALKGGTALNLFVSEVPRLSVDIDLNYLGAAERETMRADRPKVEQAVQAVCGRLGVGIKRSPPDHAGGKFRLSCITVSGRTTSLELDVNFMFRTPLWPPTKSDSWPIGSCRATQVPVLDVHELAAGKMAALLARSAGRDLFDVREILAREDLDVTKLRLGFVVYGGINRKDWRGVSVDDIQADPEEVDRTLLPLLRAELVPPKGEIARWTRSLVDDCRGHVSALLPLAPNEREFIERLNEKGDIVSELLTPDEVLQATIREHPGLRWKAQNVKQHFGIASDEER